MRAVIPSKVRDMFYTEGHWAAKAFWNSLFLAFLLMPCGINLPTPFFVISMVFGLFLVFRNKGKFSFEPALLLFPLYFFMLCLGLIFSANLLSGLDLVQRSLSLLLFPIIFMFVKEDAATVRRLFDFLLVGLLVSFGINITGATWAYFSYISEYSTGKEIFPVVDMVLHEWHRFYLGDALSKSVNPNYISIYILLVLGYYLKNPLLTKTRLAVVILLFAYIYLLASGTAYLILALMSFLLVSNITEKSWRYNGFILFILGLFVFLNNPRISGYYELAKHFGQTTDQRIMVLGKAKVLSWDASWQLIKEEPLFGYGTGDANDALKEKYDQLEYRFNAMNRYNAHNQFFQTYLQIGFAGFAVLIGIFIFLGIRLKNSRNELSVFLILFISLLVESMLVRFNGIVFFSVVVPLLLKRRSILGGRVIRNNEKVIPLKPSI